MITTHNRTIALAEQVALTKPVTTPAQPFKLASRRPHRANTIVDVGGVLFGAEAAVIIAGPCSVESRAQIIEAAHGVKDAGAVALRGGAYKPRTSPYEFRGLGREALEYLCEARGETGLPIVTEVMATEDVDVVAAHADMLQIGARNMQNYALLRRVGETRCPVLLKRAPAATIKEWLLAAEHILAAGNPNVVLCERGIRSFDTELRNTFDLSAVALAKSLTHLPVIADPSHGTGRRDIIPQMSRAALACGADGLIIEVHPRPEEALSDGAQSLNPAAFAELMRNLKAPMRIVARTADVPCVAHA